MLPEKPVLLARRVFKFSVGAGASFAINKTRALLPVFGAYVASSMNAPAQIPRVRHRNKLLLIVLRWRRKQFKAPRFKFAFKPRFSLFSLLVAAAGFGVSGPVSQTDDNARAVDARCAIPVVLVLHVDVGSLAVVADAMLAIKHETRLTKTRAISALARALGSAALARKAAGLRRF